MISAMRATPLLPFSVTERWPLIPEPPARLLEYQRRIGAAPPKTEIRHEGPLEQRLGDQFGWEELTADVARIYRSLPPQEAAGLSLDRIVSEMHAELRPARLSCAKLPLSVLRGAVKQLPER